MKVPSSGWDERRLRRGILPFVKVEDYLKYFTVFEIRREKKEARENVKVLEGVNLDEEFPVFRDFVSHLKPPVMVIIGTDWLEYQYRLKALGNLEEALRDIRLLDNGIERGGKCRRIRNAERGHIGRRVASLW